MVILEAQVTQICSMDILRLITDFIKNVQSLVLKYGVLWRVVTSWVLRLLYGEAGDLEVSRSVTFGALIAQTPGLHF